MGTKQYYVQGAIYPQHSPNQSTIDESAFRLVSPSGDKSLPYVWTDSFKANWLCQHHSHTYAVSEDRKTLTKVRDNFIDTIGAPAEVVLTTEMSNQIKEAIDKGGL